MKRASVSGQGEITAATFDSQNRLWVGDIGARASLYDLETGSKVETLSPPTGLISKLFRYGLDPFYRYCPKPGEFYKVVAHVSSTSSKEEDISSLDLRRAQTEEDPWRPLWTGLLFMGVMLVIAGTVFHYQDF